MFAKRLSAEQTNTKPTSGDTATAPRSDKKKSKLAPVPVVGGAVVVSLLLFKLLRKKEKARTSNGFAKLIEDPESQYTPLNPQWLVEAAKWAENGLPSDVEFDLCPLIQEFESEAAAEGWTCAWGVEARKKLFALNPDSVYLNHGSYGAAFRLCVDTQSWYVNLLEQQPVKFMETTGIRALIAARDAVSAFIHAQPGDVVTLPNATTAINTVIKSLKLKGGDRIMMTSLTYPAVRSTIACAASAAGAQVVEVQLPGTVLNDQQLIVKSFRKALKLGQGRIRLVVVDHVASFPPVHFPLNHIIPLCHSFGAKVLVDGSHAIGSMPLDVPSYGAEFYTSNLHKWLCTPKGTALLWVKGGHQSSIQPLVVSHGYGLGFQAEFLWQGTSDFTSWLAVPAALAVWHALGTQNVWRENHILLQQALEEVEKAFGPRQVFGLDSEYSCMAAFDLPPLAGRSPTPAAASYLHDVLREQFNIEIPVVYWMHKFWVRFSAQMYNYEDEYRSFIDALVTLGAQLRPEMTSSVSDTSCQTSQTPTSELPHAEAAARASASVESAPENPQEKGVNQSLMVGNGEVEGQHQNDSEPQVSAATVVDSVSDDIEVRVNESEEVAPASAAVSNSENKEAAVSIVDNELVTSKAGTGQDNDDLESSHLATEEATRQDNKQVDSTKASEGAAPTGQDNEDSESKHVDSSKATLDAGAVVSNVPTGQDNEGLESSHLATEPATEETSKHLDSTEASEAGAVVSKAPTGQDNEQLDSTKGTLDVGAVVGKEPTGQDSEDSESSHLATEATTGEASKNLDSTKASEAGAVSSTALTGQDNKQADSSKLVGDVTETATGHGSDCAASEQQPLMDKATHKAQSAPVTANDNDKDEETAPVREETAPVREETAPVSEETAPVSKETAPVSEETAPASKETAPVREETAPTSEEAAPASEETAPVGEETAPVGEETAPVREEAAPVREETATKMKAQNGSSSSGASKTTAPDKKALSVSKGKAKKNKKKNRK